jgi:hypothetical protein
MDLSRDLGRPAKDAHPTSPSGMVSPSFLGIVVRQVYPT